MSFMETLTDFFSNLQDRSITVCHNCTEKDVLAQKRVSDIGYCFYRPNEAEKANETGKLYLSWGCYSNDEMDLLVVVNAITDEAKACNLTATWKGSKNDRVIIGKGDMLSP